MKILRRLRSAVLTVRASARSSFIRLIVHHFQEGITLAKDVSIGSRVVLSATDAGFIQLGHGVGICSGSKFVARGGRIDIGPNVFLGDGSIVVSLTAIEIGAGTQIAEYVVIRDQDHDITRRPFTAGHFQSARIRIGTDCWIGAKATILRGSNIGDGAVIGAHSVVRGEIPPYSLAVGAPARVVKTFSAASGMHECPPQEAAAHSDAKA
jgi:acetyltransferase-like isoleucine patch superfamily enzyme